MTKKEPGRLVLDIMSRFCHPKTLDRIVVPVIADMQAEMREARGARRGRRAWIAVRSYTGLCRALLAHSIVERRRTSQPGRSRVVPATVGAVLIFTAVLLALPLTEGYAAADRMPLAVFFLPQALGVAVPLGLLFGIAIGTTAHGGIGCRREIAGAIALGAAAMVVTFVMTSWVIPAANQSFREAVYRQMALRGSDGTLLGAPAPGAAEMSRAELAAAVSLARWQNPRLARTLTRQQFWRSSLPVACVVLAFSGVAIGTLAGRRRVVRGVVATAFAVGYYALMYVGQHAATDFHLPTALSALAANGAVIVLVVLWLALARPADCGLNTERRP